MSSGTEHDTSAPLFQIEDLRVSVGGNEVLRGVDLLVNRGETHGLMGRNGSGKTTLAHTIMGHPKYTVTSGRILMNGEDISHLPPDERARRRLFLAFQYPVAIPGVSVGNFLRTAVKAVRGAEVPVRQFRKLLTEKMQALDMEPSFAARYVNDGFSGGEKKRLEILQMAVLQPLLAVLDETDSGLDIDALRIVCEGINNLKGPELGILLITHYQRMLNYVRPDYVHVIMDGRIVRSGGPELALVLEEKGYEWIESER